MSLAAIFVPALVLLVGVADSQDPSVDPAIFLPVQEVGNPQGAAATLYGCSDNGATVTALTIWSTADFIRGMQIFLSDGRNQLFGCVNTTLPTGPFIGCLDHDIEDATFSFAPGETLTAMNLWPGQYEGDAVTSDAERVRAGAVAFNTSMGRYFDFGMRVTRPAPTVISIGSGILCGIDQHVGADINSMGFVFLQPVAASALGEIAYQGVPAAQVEENGLQVALSEITVANSTLDNEDGSGEHSYTYNSTLQQEQYANWSRSAVSLDSNLESTVNGGAPVLAASDDGRDLQGWTVAPAAAQARLTQSNVSVPWSYNVSVPGGGIDAVMVSYNQAIISGLPYTANMTVQLVTGSSFAVPIQGTYEGYTYSPIVTDLQVIKAPPPPSPVIVPASTQSNGVGSNLRTDDSSVSSGSSGGGSNDNKLAIILGVLLGVLACLVVAAIIIALLVVRRRKRDNSETDSESGRSSSQGPAALGYILPWGTRRDGGGSRTGSRRGERGERATQPADFGLPDPKLGEGDVAGAQPLAGPSPRPSQDMPSPKEQALARSSPASDATTAAAAGAAAGAATGAAAGAAREGSPDENKEMPYSLYRSLRLDNIRSALGLGRRPSEASPPPPANIEMKNTDAKMQAPADAQKTPGKADPDADYLPPHSPISGIQWGFPVQSPPQDPSEPPAKSAFHLACDPVLQSQQAAQDKYESLMSDTASTTTGVVTTAAPSEAGESAADDSRPPTRGSEVPTVGSEIPSVAEEERKAAVPAAPASEAPSGLSRLSRTASGEEEHFVEPKYLRPGEDDDDALLVEPTHGRIAGYESRPAASRAPEGAGKVVEHEGDSITLGKRPKSAQAAEPSGKRIMVEETPVSLGGKYRAPEKPGKNVLRYDDAELKLGKGYQTQGRNE